MISILADRSGTLIFTVRFIAVLLAALVSGRALAATAPLYPSGGDLRLRRNCSKVRNSCRCERGWKARLAFAAATRGATAAASDVNPALNSVSHNERQQFIAFSECSQLDGYKLHGRAHLCGSFLLFSAA